MPLPAGERSFDLIISDISTPEMDGYQLLKQIRGLANGGSLPALALTGYGRSHDIKRAQAEGFADHLTKPIDINRFLRTGAAIDGRGVRWAVRTPLACSMPRHAYR